MKLVAQILPYKKPSTLYSKFKRDWGSKADAILHELEIYPDDITYASWRKETYDLEVSRRLTKPGVDAKAIYYGFKTKADALGLALKVAEDDVFGHFTIDINNIINFIDEDYADRYYPNWRELEPEELVNMFDRDAEIVDINKVIATLRDEFPTELDTDFLDILNLEGIVEIEGTYWGKWDQ